MAYASSRGQITAGLEVDVVHTCRLRNSSEENPGTRGRQPNGSGESDSISPAGGTRQGRPLLCANGAHSHVRGEILSCC